MTILVTGGTGTLGRECLATLHGSARLRLTSRRPAPANIDSAIEWVQIDLGTVPDLGSVLGGVDRVLHLASDPSAREGATDLEVTRRLLVGARAAGVQHVVFVSIVGIDRIPYRYYVMKLAVESLIRESGVPWTILRATQFHPFLDRIIGGLARVPVVLPAPMDFRFQPIDTGAVAARLAALVFDDPQRRIIEIGGPDVLTSGELIRSWLRGRRVRRLPVHLPLPGRVAAGFRQGFNTTPQAAAGSRTWIAWLEDQAR